MANTLPLTTYKRVQSPSPADRHLGRAGPPYRVEPAFRCFPTARPGEPRRLHFRSQPPKRMMYKILRILCSFLVQLRRRPW